ncbi:potassium channel family protein [Flavihumibacter profundi]|uniref:potassium channel family protein n=1 Tax=Flavihumibacter profundi TaxID=2716883 RepID=UPI001CC460C3|nr:potassium channel family protein [Flavihumibacter profundi]MBZ5857170.1 potassium channel family protein [Flavihumibacter profundi]
MYHKIKKHTHILLHPTKEESRWDKVINGFIIILILLNLVAVILETEPELATNHAKLFHDFDVFSVFIFSVEYILRVWSCTYEAKYKHWLWGRLRYMFTWGALIDLVAILPFYLGTVKLFDLRELRLLRLVRLLRIFRLTSYMKSAQVIANVFKNRFQELLISLVLTSGLIIIASCLIYFAEHTAQPEKFGSIPRTLWWSVVTLATIGYGDMVPITVTGKILTGIIAMAGVAFFALPAGIITAGFLEEIRKVKKHHTTICPHCGLPIEHEVHADH